MPRNWENRQKKLEKRKHGMRVSGKSVFVIQKSERKRNEKSIKKARELKGNN